MVMGSLKRAAALAVFAVALLALATGVAEAQVPHAWQLGMQKT